MTGSLAPAVVSGHAESSDAAWVQSQTQERLGSLSIFTPLKGLSERAEPSLMEIAEWSSMSVS